MMRCLRKTWLLLLLTAASAAAQPQSGIVRVHVAQGAAPVEGAVVSSGASTTTTDAKGVGSITIAAGEAVISVAKPGFVTATARVDVQPGGLHEVIVDLQPQPTVEEEVTVSATRTNQRIEDVPMRVEVLGREEIEEKMLMTPGDIVMMLNEMGGMRVQATSPSLGAATVRVQGMKGRYTKFLSDGLPLFGEQVGSLGLLQIPPMDLGQVEVIKGVASSLYGAGAMGGVVNLVSRRPGEVTEREILINRSSRGATDAVLWYSAPLSDTWGMTFVGSGNWQQRADVNDDGWADLPGYSRGVFRPRFFRDAGDGSTLFATVGTTIERRRGGTMQNAVLPATGRSYTEALDTTRLDGGVSAQRLLRGRYVFTARAAVANQRHRHEFGEHVERDRHDTGFGEVAVRGSAGRHTWVAGAALEYDGYTNTTLPAFDHRFAIPGVFVQDDVEVAPWMSLSASGRIDYHSEYGAFFSPRFGALFRSGSWNSRLSVGTGFFGPSALTEETEAAGLTRLRIPGALKAERGRGGAIDISRTDGPLSYTVTLFASRVVDPIDVDRAGGLVLGTAVGPNTNTGIDVVTTFRRAPFALTTTYTYVRSREFDGPSRVDSPLTPRHSAGLVGMWEREDAGRVGVEWYYTGVQPLEDNPFRTRSRPYMIVGALAEKPFGKVRLFINGENLTGTRQTRYDPLIRPSRAADGRWTVDAWAPLEGRNINGGIRIHF